MKYFKDVQGQDIRLTEERERHLLSSHPEMADQVRKIGEALSDPDVIVESRSDTSVDLYYHYYQETAVGGKYLCVVVKIKENDRFILTSYLTDKVKQGEVKWKRK